MAVRKQPARLRSNSKPLPLGKKEREQIPFVRDEDLLRMFPGRGRTRSWLREQRRIILQAMPPATRVEAESQEIAAKAVRRSLDAKYQEVLRQKRRLERDLEAVLAMRQGVDPVVIKSRPVKGKLSATAVTQYSDGHCDEVILPAKINGLNEFNPEIYSERAGSYFREVVAEVSKLGRSGTTVSNLVLHLGGDAFSGSIHEDQAESNAMGPIDAVIFAQNTITGGIQYIADNTDCELDIVCNMGNHSRITDERRIATEKENSLEHYMHWSIARELRSDRIHFTLADGIHAYLTINGVVCRFQHGADIRYSRNVGGVTIPINKAIQSWNEARHADLDFICHFHTMMATGRFVLNGSLVGYSPYSLHLKAPYQPPQQSFTVIDEYGRNHGTTAILVDR